MEPTNLNLPALTTAQMTEVDRAMIEEYHIELIQMMENAGRCLADLARQRFFNADPRGKKVVVLAGTGGNGGGALVCARHLHNWGAQVQVILSKTTRAYTGLPAHQLDIVRRLYIPVDIATPSGVPRAPYLVVDGLIGYNLAGSPRRAAAQLIRWANAQPAPILALDVPSGLDATTGRRYEPVIEAAATLTLALPKRGLMLPESAPYVGELYLADIGVPPELYQSPPLELQVGPIFAETDILRLC
jgi:NAD(P)H-hydrate epimerase